MDQEILTLLLTYKYWIILPLSLVEGPMMAVIIGFLAATGVYSLVPAYLLLVGADVVTDCFYYHVGRVANHGDFLRKYGKKIRLTEEHLADVAHLWNKHTVKTMFISKFAFGLSAILLITAGAVRMSRFRFALNALTVSIVAYALFLFAGYYFGQFYITLETYIDYAGYSAAAVILLFFIGYILLAKRMKKEILHEIDTATSASEVHS